MIKPIAIPFILLAGLLLSGCQEGFLKPSDQASSTDDLVQLKQDAATAYAQKDYQTALPMYQELNRKIPKDAMLWLRTGNIHARLKQPNLAIQHYQNAVKADPGLSTAWHNMGVLQLRIAANTFVQMVQSIDADDPLYPKAIRLSEAILQVVSGKPQKQTEPTQQVEAEQPAESAQQSESSEQSETAPEPETNNAQ